MAAIEKTCTYTISGLSELELRAIWNSMNAFKGCNNTNETFDEVYNLVRRML